MPDPTHKLRLEYFRSESGREEVAEWIDNRPPSQRAKLFWVLERLAESGFALGPPCLKKLDDEIWEIRVQAANLCLRVLLYARNQKVLVLLLAFAKKSRRTPKRKIDTARARMMRDWERKGGTSDGPSSKS